MATIEFIGFVALHLFGLRRGLFIQGFLGGLLSSTMFYIQMSDREKTAYYHHSEIISSLILATIAMLTLAETIILTLANKNFFQLSLPILLQITGLILCLFFFKKKGPHPHLAKQTFVIIEDPIVWKNVLKFTLILSVILIGVKALNLWIPQSYLISTLIISFFETHAILAAYLSGSETITYQPQTVLMVILFGNIISKIFLTMRSTIPEIKFPVISSLVFSYLIALLSLL